MWWRSVGLKAFYDQWRGTVGLAVAVAAYAGMIMGIFPSITGIADLGEIFDRLPEAMRVLFAPGGVDITTPEGFVATEFFSIIGPLLFFAYTIALGGSATAGEEERGTIDVLMSTPISRGRVVLEKFVSLTVGTVLIGAALLAGLAAGALAGGVDLRLDGIAAIIASAVLLGLLFGALALFVGALTGRRTLSIGVAFGIAIASYLVYSLSDLVDLIKPLRPFSAFTYYIGDSPLVNGLQPLSVAVLAVTTVVLLGLALLAFERRDLRV
jgi:ABC-2 type transport system permease protein